MKPAALLLVLLQAVCTGCAVVLGVWAKLPWPGTLALAVLGAAVALAGLAADGRAGTPVRAALGTRNVLVGMIRRAQECPPYRGGLQRWFIIAAWGCTFAAPASVLLAKTYTPDCYDGAMAWLMAATIIGGAFSRSRLAIRAQCKVLGMTWAFLGSLLWLAGAYWQNLAGPFYLGLLVSAALLIVCHLWFRLSGWGITTVNTLLLVVLGLPIVDLFLHPAYRTDLRPETGVKLYSYQAAKGDPDAFRHWWNYYLDQWNLMGKAIFAPDPTGALPFRLRPNSRTCLFQSEITINSLGFRGKEFPREKGKAYRIVALGESTTFGCTLKPEDRPWPEVLEQLIAERLHPQRPVEVINAGVPSYNLRQNLYRLRTEILPLQPDLIISYHGANGFPMLDAALPTLSGTIPPVYRPRPLKLLANCEFRLKVLYCRHLQTPRSLFHPPTLSDALDSDYAGAYRELIQLCHTNGIHLALANYSMAANGRSDPRIIDFYSSTYPAVARTIQANQVHSEMLRRLALEHPEVCLVDTHPNLDGAEDKFIDLLHFAQEGRQLLAEHVFAGIKGLLETDLAAPP